VVHWGRDWRKDTDIVIHVEKLDDQRHDLIIMGRFNRYGIYKQTNGDWVF